MTIDHVWWEGRSGTASSVPACWFAGFGNHRLENRKAARTDEAAAHIAVGVHNDSCGEFTAIKTSTCVIPFIKQNRVIDFPGLHRPGDFFADFIQRRPISSM